MIKSIRPFAFLFASAAFSLACSGTPTSHPEEVTTVSQAISSVGGSWLNVSTSYIGGSALAVGAGPAAPWAIGFNGQPFQFTGVTTHRAWTNVPIATTGVRIAVSPEGTPWLLDFGNHFWRFNGTTWLMIPAPNAANVIGGCAKDIGVGAGNKAWAVGCDDDGVAGASVFFWTESSQTWTQWPGRAKRIAVSPEGDPWIVDDAHNVKRHSSTGFTQVSSGNATAIGVGPNDTAWIIGVPASGASDAVASYWDGTPAVSAFIVSSSAVLGKEISVGADGTPWMVASNTNIFQWRNDWASLGPSGGFPVTDAAPARYSGDVEDIDTSDVAHHRIVVGTAGGGVWVLNTSNNTWSSIADMHFGPGPSGAVASLAQKPGDANQTLVVATGLINPNGASAQAGNGIWRGSFVGGLWRWSSIGCQDLSGNVATCPLVFSKIRYNPANSNVIYASTFAPLFNQSAFFVSTNGGPFVPTHGLNSSDKVSDFAVDPNGQRIYIAVMGTGIKISNDGGQSVSSITVPSSLPQSGQFFSAKVALAPSDPTVAYLTVTNQGDQFEGIYKGTNMRTAPAWVQTAMGPCLTQDGCSTGDSYFLQTQFNHNQAIAVNPQDSTIFIASGTKAWRATNSGGVSSGICSCRSGPTVPPNSSWSLVGNVHDDWHAIAFAGGSNVYAATDGGFYNSTDGGATWGSSLNTIPVMQEDALSVFNDVIVATAWDVGAHYSFDHGTTWSSVGAVSGIDFNGCNASSAAGPTELFVSNFSSGTISSSFNGSSWATASSNVLTQFPASVRDGTVPIVDIDNGLWFSTGTSTWTGITQASVFNNFLPYGAQLPSQPLWVTVADTPSVCEFVVAAGFPQSNNTSLNVQISAKSCGSIVNGPWSEVGASLPHDIIRVVRDTPNSGGGVLAGDPVIYVLTGLGRVFMNNLSVLATAPGGGTWKELTGNLFSLNGSVQFNSVLGDPVHHTAFVGTSVGVFKTTNACVNTSTPCVWQPWGQGLPLHPSSLGLFNGGTSGANGDPGTAVTQLTGQMRSLDSSHPGQQRFYVYAATWERGVWTRDATADDL